MPCRKRSRKIDKEASGGLPMHQINDFLDKHFYGFKLYLGLAGFWLDQSPLVKSASKVWFSVVFAFIAATELLKKFCRPVSREARHDRGDGVRLDDRDVDGSVHRPALRPLPAGSDQNEGLFRHRGDRLPEYTRLRGGRRVHGFRYVLLQIGHDLPRYAKPV
uniref:Uncharacterized protein n=1 Tax=Trichogramma kaykai TaxID=54128 RepID=A0ABD2X7W0_9HYME